jgi:hypothetical protein
MFARALLSQDFPGISDRAHGNLRLDSIVTDSRLAGPSTNSPNTSQPLLHRGTIMGDSGDVVMIRFEGEAATEPEQELALSIPIANRKGKTTRDVMRLTGLLYMKWFTEIPSL